MIMMQYRVYGYLQFIVKAPYITLLKYYELYSIPVIEQVSYHS